MFKNLASTKTGVFITDSEVFLEKYPFYMWRHILFKLFCSF